MQGIQEIQVVQSNSVSELYHENNRICFLLLFQLIIISLGIKTVRPQTLIFSKVHHLNIALDLFAIQYVGNELFLKCNTCTLFAHPQTFNKINVLQLILKEFRKILLIGVSGINIQNYDNRCISYYSIEQNLDFVFCSGTVSFNTNLIKVFALSWIIHLPQAMKIII